MAEYDHFMTTQRDDYKDPRSYASTGSQHRVGSRDAQEPESKVYHRSSLEEELRSVHTKNLPSGKNIEKASSENSCGMKHGGTKDSKFFMTMKSDGNISENDDEKDRSLWSSNPPGRQRTKENDHDSRTKTIPPSGAHQPEEPLRDLSRLEEQIRATIYGQCMGDAIGLLTEFMSKEEAHKHYRKYADLEFSYKVRDRHRDAWEIGDWTDDSDHMLLIMRSLRAMQGKVDANDFARKLYEWSNKGFPELHDQTGMGLGRTTRTILSHPGFVSNPQRVSEDIWIKRGRVDAPNGGVMRTSILGIHEWWDVERVEKNAALICRTTHFDPRCVASAVAVSVAISMMLRRQAPYYNASTKEYHVTAIIHDSYQRASKYLDKEDEKMELHRYMTREVLAELELDAVDGMGYTFKCLGAGFWALRQNNFRSAIQKLTMQGGDADTNCAVAGALLGCKIGVCELLPRTWMSSLANKSWLREEIERYLNLHHAMYRSYVRDGGGKPYHHSRY